MKIQIGTGVYGWVWSTSIARGNPGCLVYRHDSTYKFTFRKGVDNQGAYIDNCIKVYNKKSDGMQGKLLKFVIKFYQTSSVANTNGSRVDLFLSDIYPKLCNTMKKSCKNLTVINE
jgi:hypothetical protein